METMFGIYDSQDAEIKANDLVVWKDKTARVTEYGPLYSMIRIIGLDTTDPMWGQEGVVKTSEIKRA